MSRSRSLCLVALLALAGGALQAAPDDYKSQYLDRAKVRAQENRYLARKAEAIRPAVNMEPRMIHCDQIQRSWNKLSAGGFCVPELGAEAKKFWAGQCPALKAPPANPSCRRPNVLIFLVDDMGWGDFGAYGGGPMRGAPTPNVDQLAREGLMLTSTYAQPTCSPTRATIHTGQLPIHHGVLSPPMYGDPGGLTPQAITLPHLLKKQGYTTVGVGKWHLGNGTDNLPTNVGYDEYFGFLNVSDMYTEWRDHHFNPEVAYDEDRTRLMQEEGFNHYLIQDSVKRLEQRERSCVSLAEITLPGQSVAPGPTRGNDEPCPKDPSKPDARVSISDLDQQWADYSVNFIRSQQGATKPWFLYHATRGCHFDNYPREEFQRKSYSRTSYGDCTVEMDEVLGRLMHELEATGQDGNTLVFFTSDNGPEDEIDPHGYSPFRGGKGDTWEGGVRVPGIARWKGMIDPLRQSDGLFDLADLYPTVLGLAGLDYGSDASLKKRYVDGVDQASFLLDTAGESNRRSILYWITTTFTAVRMDEFKAHRSVSQPIGLEQGFYGGLSGLTLPTTYMWLFNLQQDPQEKNNVFIRHLWNQGLFTAEFQRYTCTLVQFPPYLPTKPAMQMQLTSEIEMARENWSSFCGGKADDQR